MKLKWYCDRFVGDYKWHGTEVYEPDDCDTEFVTEEDAEDYKENMCKAQCPKCGATLIQDWDEPKCITIE